MKRSYKIAAALAAAAGLGMATAASAHPGMMHGGMGSGMEKMRNAKTSEERQKLAEANQAEMQKRAKEKGITPPEQHGPHAGFGPHFAHPAQR